MNTKSRLLTFACLAALTLPAVNLQASPKKAASPSPAPSMSASPAASPAMKAPRAIPFHGTVASVDEKAKSFTIAGKENSRTFMVTERTIVSKQGAAASMSDITANEMVRGSYWKHEDGKLEAKTVKVGEMTDAEKAAASKKSKKSKDSAETESQASPSPSAKKK